MSGDESTLVRSAYEVRLVVPPDAAYLRTVRLVAADAAARAGFRADELDDARIAVDELCYALMEAAELAVTLSFRETSGVLVVEGQASGRRTGLRFALPELSTRMLDHLAERYETQDTQAGAWFRLRLRGQGPPA